MLAAAFQLASPACEATTTTEPAPENDRFAPERMPFPAVTAQDVAKPELAVASSSTTFVVHWAGIAGKTIVWLPFATDTVGLAARSVNVPPLCRVWDAKA